MLAPERRLLAARATVALVAALLYAGTLGHGFVYDDDLAVVGQRVVREHRFGSVLTTPYHEGTGGAAGSGLYRPVTIFTFAAQDALLGTRPALYHAGNVALHAVVALLVLELGLSLTLPLGAAVLASALFAAHPVHVEAVAGISGRAELLAALFFLVALIAFIRARGPDGAPTLPGLAATAGAFLLAVGAKEVALVFPATALAWEALVRGAGPRRLRELVGSCAALAAPAIVYVAARSAVVGGFAIPAGSVSPIENPMIGLDLAGRTTTALSIVSRYAQLLVFPRALSPDWGFAEVTAVTSPLDLRVLAGAAIVLGAAGVAVACARARPAVAVCMVLGGSTWFLVSSIPRAIGVGMAERLLYLPSVAFCLLAAILACWMRPKIPRPVALAGAAALLLAASWKTVHAAAAWRDDFTLFAAAEHAAPRSIKVLGNLGVELAQRGRLDEATERLRRAAALAPRHVPTAINLSGVLLKAGDIPGAERAVRVALDVEPDNAVALAQLAAIRLRENDPAGAEAALRRAVLADPAFVAARMDLAALLLSGNDLTGAREELEAARKLDPGSARALHGLGLVALAEGRTADAVAFLEEALRRAPGNEAILADLDRARGTRF